MVAPAPAPARRRMWLAAGCATLVLAAYLPTVFERFANLDDYPLMIYFLRHLPVRYELQFACGRPVLAVLNEMAFGAAGGIDDLRWIRLVGVLIVVLFAWMLAAHLRRAGWTDLEAAAIAVILATLPPFQVHVMWATHGMTVPPCLLSGVAVGLVSRSVDSSGWRRWACGGAALACMLVAMWIYQPTAMFAWVFLAVALLRPDGGPPLREGARLALWTAACMAIAMVGAYAAWHVGTVTYAGLTMGGRTHLVTDLADKARFFGGRLLGAMCLHAVVEQVPRQVVPLAASVGLTTVVGLLCFLRGPASERALRLAMVLLLLPASYLPNLASAESNPTYRSQGALMALVALLLCCALRGLLRHRPAWSATLLVALALGSSAAAHYTAGAYMARPQAQELRLLEQGLAGCDTSRPIWIIGAHWNDSPAPTTPMDDFGMPSSSQYWALDPMVALLLREPRGTWRDVNLHMLTSSHYAVRVERSVAVNASRHEAFRQWRSGALLPTVVSTLQAVEPLDPVNSRWVAQAPGGRALEWRAGRFEEQADRQLAWASHGASVVQGVTRLRFEDGATPGTSTIHLLMEYCAPAETFGMPYDAVTLPPAAQVIDMRRLRELKAGVGSRP